MTNNWVDLDNSSLFLVCGANPAENHPASIAHLNTARFDVNGRGRNAALIVVDPRQTRTARMVNAGYDATNPNDMRKHDRYVRIRPGTNIAFMNGLLNAVITWMYANPTAQESINFFAWHNGTAAQPRRHRAARSSTTPASTRTVAWLAEVLRLAAQGRRGHGRLPARRRSTTAGGGTISNFPALAANVEDPDCVFQKLKAHLAPYTPAAVAEICGCTETDILKVRDAMIATSRFSSSDFGAASATVAAAGYRAACIMYAMGGTQFTSGSQGIRSYAVLQTVMGNMGRAGGGINALRGIHNVQGSTDMGNLFDLIPGYSGNPGVGQSYETYVNRLFGNRTLPGAGTTTARSGYNEADIAWQQRGFYNMTREFFGSRDITSSAADHAAFDRLYDCWPKGNGVPHIESFRRMDPAWIATNGGDQIRAAVAWGQNPAVTEPNQSAVRTGLEELDLLVCVDMFANETAQCKRKSDGVTYLLPACSHVEEAGSVTSSGRWIQWRDKCAPPQGNSKTDLELLHRMAKAMSDAGAFNHIQAQWAGTALAGQDPYAVLWGKYGWSGAGDFEAVTGVDFEGNTLTGSEYVAEQVYKEMCAPLDGYAATGPAGFVGGHKGTMWIYSTGNAGSQGGGYNPDQVGNVTPAMNDPTAIPAWGIANKAKSRLGDSEVRWCGIPVPALRLGMAAQPPHLLQRRRTSRRCGRCLRGPGLACPSVDHRWHATRLPTSRGSIARTASCQTCPMWPTPITSSRVASPPITEPYESPFDGTVAGKPNLVAKWGRNTKGSISGVAGATGNLIFGDSARGTAADFPLALTTIRCVEHFQGGPITRNNPWNVELEPKPWVEINSVDALKYGIKDGDFVNVITARSNSTTDQMGRTIQTGPLDAGTHQQGLHGTRWCWWCGQSTCRSRYRGDSVALG